MSREKITRRPDILPEHNDLGTNPNIKVVSDTPDTIGEHVKQLEFEGKIPQDIIAKRAWNVLEELDREIYSRGETHEASVATADFVKSVNNGQLPLRTELRLNQQKGHLNGFTEAVRIINNRLHGKRTRL